MLIEQELLDETYRAAGALVRRRAATALSAGSVEVSPKRFDEPWPVLADERFLRRVQVLCEHDDVFPVRVLRAFAKLDSSFNFSLHVKGPEYATDAIVSDPRTHGDCGFHL